MPGSGTNWVGELLIKHYDPAYTRSLGRNYAQAVEAETLTLRAADETSMLALANEVAVERPLARRTTTPANVIPACEQASTQ